MSPSEALAVMADGCDHRPRVGGWCVDCDRAIRAALIADPRWVPAS